MDPFGKPKVSLQVGFWTDPFSEALVGMTNNSGWWSLLDRKIVNSLAYSIFVNYTDFSN